MEIRNDTPAKNRTISGVTVQIPAPFAEGHTINEDQANALNQLLSENVGNNLRERIKKSKEEGKSAADIQAMVLEYVQGYEFGVRSGGSGKSVDPVEKEMNRLARDMVKQYLKKNGYRITGDDGIPKDQIDKLVNQVLEKYHQDLKQRAEQIVEQRQAAGNAELDLSSVA